MLILGFSVRGYVNLEISDLLINPDPSIIGKTSSISGIMLNSGIVPAKSVKINIVDDGPFSSSNTGIIIILSNYYYYYYCITSRYLIYYDYYCSLILF